MIRTAIISAEGDFVEELARAAREGYTHVEIEGMADRPETHREALAETGLFVACVRLGRGAGEEDVETRRALVERQKRMIADGAQLGATMALLTPPLAGKEQFVEGCELLSAFATSRGVRLVVRISPGTVIADIALAQTCLPKDVGTEEVWSVK